MIYRNSIWQDISFAELNKGDTFRMFEPDGELVKDERGNTEFLTISNPYINKDKVWAVEVLEEV